MKCTNKKFISFILICSLVMVSVLSGCAADSGDSDVWMPFSEYAQDFHVTTGRTAIVEDSPYDDRISGFASDFCVFDSDVTSGNFDAAGEEAALLISVEDNEVLYAKNAFDKRYPASITKIMTAYTACKTLSADSAITVSDAVTESITDPEAVMLGVSTGDSMTLDQALRLALLSSYNDVAVAIGCQAGGSPEGFADLMNAEALKLGCTGTHFVNASGLQEEDHYTTAYDLYLIFKEVINDPYLLEIIQMQDYSTVIQKADGSDWSVSSVNTNQYFKGNYNPPSNILIVGGKTGTTDQAGRCLMLMVRDTNSKPYIAIILNADSLDDLYTQMNEMLSLCNLSS